VLGGGGADMEKSAGVGAADEQVGGAVVNVGGVAEGAGDGGSM